METVGLVILPSAEGLFNLQTWVDYLDARPILDMKTLKFCLAIILTLLLKVSFCIQMLSSYLQA
jgi:hypothetical protein